jgi:hypothetical protein
MTSKIKGGCFCGEVRYEITGDPIAMGKCHCRDCKLATGSGYFPYILVSPDALKIKGECTDHIVKGSSGKDVHRSFCPSCGTYIFGEPTALEGLRTVSGATVDNPEDYQPDTDIWVEHAYSWDTLDPKTKKFDRSPDR